MEISPTFIKSHDKASYLVIASSLPFKELSIWDVNIHFITFFPIFNAIICAQHFLQSAYMTTLKPGLLFMLRKDSA